MVVVGLNFSGKALILPMLALSSLFFLSAMLLAEGETSEKPGEWEKRLEMLRAVPYIAFSETSTDESDTGVVLHNPEKACDGYSLYMRSAGEVFLLDMGGRVVHRWTYSSPERSTRSEYALMLENGDLLVIRTFRELIRLDWDSKVLWKIRLAAHHDVTMAPDGTFYVIIREYKHHRSLRVEFDALVHLTADGEELSRWYTYDHLSELKSILDTRLFLDTLLDSLLAGQQGGSEDMRQLQEALTPQNRHLDYFHMNTVNVVPDTPLGKRDSRFQKGNLLVCFRNVNQIAMLEKNTYRLLWAWGEGELDWPHHPTMLEDGHILIFDNGTHRKYSRVVELDPLTEAIVWEYMADPPEEFFSSLAGSSQRLPYGNTLICESNRGRVFEVTEEGEKVWMWLHPVTRRKRGVVRRKVLYRMTRLPAAAVDRLLYTWWWWE